MNWSRKRNLGSLLKSFQKQTLEALVVMSLTQLSESAVKKTSDRLSKVLFLQPAGEKNSLCRNLFPAGLRKPQTSPLFVGIFFCHALLVRP